MLSEWIISCFTVLSYPGDGPPPKPPLIAPLTPAPAAATKHPVGEGVDWAGLGRTSARFLGVMQGFRCSSHELLTIAVHRSPVQEKSGATC